MNGTRPMLRPSPARTRGPQALRATASALWQGPGLAEARVALLFCPPGGTAGTTRRVLAIPLPRAHGAFVAAASVVSAWGTPLEGCQVGCPVR